MTIRLRPRASARRFRETRGYGAAVLAALLIALLPSHSFAATWEAVALPLAVVFTPPEPAAGPSRTPADGPSSGQPDAAATSPAAPDTDTDTDTDADAEAGLAADPALEADPEEAHQREQIARALLIFGFVVLVLLTFLLMVAGIAAARSIRNRRAIDARGGGRPGRRRRTRGRRPRPGSGEPAASADGASRDKANGRGGDEEESEADDPWSAAGRRLGQSASSRPHDGRSRSGPDDD